MESELRVMTKRMAEMLLGNIPLEERDYHIWHQFDRELAKELSTFVVGRLYSRGVLDQKQRELCAVAALTVLARREELRLHVHAARNVGATSREIAEVIFQTATYGGVPVVGPALKVAKGVFEERGEWPIPTP